MKYFCTGQTQDTGVEEVDISPHVVLHVPKEVQYENEKRVS